MYEKIFVDLWSKIKSFEKYFSFFIKSQMIRPVHGDLPPKKLQKTAGFCQRFLKFSGYLSKSSG